VSALAIDNLVGGYGAADHVVKGVSLRVALGELVTVIGPNGAGKSTVLKLAVGLLQPKSGRVGLLGTDVTGLSPQRILASGLVLVPQERNVFAALSVEENLLMGAYTTPRLARSRLDAVLARFPLLAERRRAMARMLSGGQRQVLAMGIALMSEPKVLALDEPTAGLAPKVASELFGVIRGLARDGLAVLMVEQNAIEALQVSDRAEVLVDGRNARSGKAGDLSADPEIRKLFLGGRAAA
jgi:branched-chain amino acid transport system ATP-binding protein